MPNFRRFLERCVEGSFMLMLRGLKLLQDAIGPEPEPTQDPAAAERIRMAVAAVGANPGMMPGGITLMVPLPVMASEAEDQSGPGPEAQSAPVPDARFPRLYVPPADGDDSVENAPQPVVQRRPLRVFRPETECA